MSKIFKVSGNFTEDGEWAKQNPAFKGEIIVNETGKFYGWCEQLYIEGSAGNKSGLTGEISKVRCLVGALAEEEGGYSLLFFKLSNTPWQTPLLYEIHGASAADCIWSAKDPNGGFVPQGNASVLLEEVPYSEENADKIKKHFCDVDISVSPNDELVRRVDSWKAKTVVRWE